ncbi:MAG: hypothetical protein AAF938_17085 [Myxococcota bacterium]
MESSLEARAQDQAMRLIEEALHGVASPVVASQIVAQALAFASVETVPEGGALLRELIDVHLRAAARIFVGEVAAEAVHSRLAPFVSHFPSPSYAPRISGVVRRGERHDPFTCDTSRPSAFGLVVMLSTDDGAVHQMRDWLGDVDLQSASDVLSLIDVVRSSRHRPVALFVDCEHAPIQPSTLAMLLPELPGVSATVLWRVPSEGSDWTAVPVQRSLSRRISLSKAAEALHASLDHHRDTIRLLVG